VNGLKLPEVACGHPGLAPVYLPVSGARFCPLLPDFCLPSKLDSDRFAGNSDKFDTIVSRQD
jgi:hypothetical protein